MTVNTLPKNVEHPVRRWPVVRCSHALSPIACADSPAPSHGIRCSTRHCGGFPNLGGSLSNSSLCRPSSAEDGTMALWLSHRGYLKGGIGKSTEFPVFWNRLIWCCFNAARSLELVIGTAPAPSPEAVTAWERLIDPVCSPGGFGAASSTLYDPNQLPRPPLFGYAHCPRGSLEALRALQPRSPNVNSWDIEALAGLLVPPRIFDFLLRRPLTLRLFPRLARTRPTTKNRGVTSVQVNFLVLGGPAGHRFHADASTVCFRQQSNGDFF